MEVQPSVVLPGVLGSLLQADFVVSPRELVCPPPYPPPSLSSVMTLGFYSMVLSILLVGIHDKFEEIFFCRGGEFHMLLDPYSSVQFMAPATWPRVCSCKMVTVAVSSSPAGTDKALPADHDTSFDLVALAADFLLIILCST